MTKTLILTAVCAGFLSAATGVARADSMNPLGLDAGPVHQPVPTQVTTYYPPPRGIHHHHYRVHR